MKIGIIGILNNPSKSLNSHSAGWNEIIRKMISKDAVILSEKDEWNDFDILIINHGPNFKPGSFNIIGGFTQEHYIRIEKALAFKGELYQIDGFQFDDFFVKRKLPYFYGEKIKDYIIEKKDRLVIGDSHSLSIWPNSNYSISRNDGKTLYGFLKDPKPANALYFGNIDIRFHLARQADPIKATLELVKRYIKFAKTCNATLVCLLPVENEDRKLPGTGLYKGQKFFGSRELRSKLVEIFNNELLSSGLNVLQWPKKWYEDINYYQENVMEPKQSVHIRPKFYYDKNI